MNEMTFEVKDGYTITYINGVEVNRAKVKQAGMTEQDVEKSIEDAIEANPTDEATDTLTKLKVGETVYSI